MLVVEQATDTDVSLVGPVVGLLADPQAAMLTSVGSRANRRVMLRRS
jgi:hypothetical protein